ncbi:stage II sporulation protein M [Candidatus Woesearchaeota archaeon]|nr:stage II sporulation protein M [Candidatus Woesearchaeota archaeon]MBW3022328.1 stage II sporulation protein M [Candidatus Woesearchaeota archaeon]
MFERFFEGRWLLRRTRYSFFLGLGFPLLALLASYVLFHYSGTRHLISITMILFTVIIALPIVNKLIMIEERRETKKKVRFFKDHEPIVDFYLYFFLGLFITFLLIAIFAPGLVFSEQQLYGGAPQVDVVQQRNLPPPPSVDSGYKVILRNNLLVLAIAFFLSLFYNSGALFIIILNAAIFASALASVIRQNLPLTNIFHSASFVVCNLGIMFFHMVPEVISYFFAAIAGGVLSKAISKEVIASKRFDKVFKDSLIFLGLSIGFLLLAGFVESEVSKKLFSSGVCVTNQYLIIFVAVAILVFILLLELYRKEKWFFRKEEKKIETVIKKERQRVKKIFKKSKKR